MSGARDVLEIACDESGYEGEKLIGTTTDVFAHASVDLDTASAAACLAELRDRIRSPAREYKANHLLREKHRAVLAWLLGPAGPLHGPGRVHGHVHLIEKEFWVLDRLGASLLGTDVGPLLHRTGRQVCAPGPWTAFLRTANDLLRTGDKLDRRVSVDVFLDAVDRLRRAGPPTDVDEILRRLHAAAPTARRLRERLADDPAAVPVLDPLVPAIVRAVGHWTADGTAVEVVHDRQNILSVDRIATITGLLLPPADPAVGSSRPPYRGRLRGLRLADSEADPRIQVADILAGTVRKIASDELDRRGDPELTALLRPFLDPRSIWGDEASWARLGPGRRRTGATR